MVEPLTYVPIYIYIYIYMSGIYGNTSYMLLYMKHTQNHVFYWQYILYELPQEDTQPIHSYFQLFFS